MINSLSKHSILVVIVLIASTLSTPVFSRDIPQGIIEVGGDLDVGFSSSETTKTGSTTSTVTDTRTIEAMVAYYFARNVGVGIVWQNTDTDVTSGSFSSNSKTNLIGPAIVLNHSLSDPLNLILRGALFLSDTTVTSSNGPADGSNGNGFLIGGGFRYFIVNNVSFDATFDFISFSEEIDSTNDNLDTDSVRLGVGVTVYIY